MLNTGYNGHANRRARLTSGMFTVRRKMTDLESIYSISN